MYNYKEESVKRIRERIERSGIPAYKIAEVVRSQVYDLFSSRMMSEYTVKTEDGQVYRGSSLENALANYFLDLARIVFDQKT